MLKTKAFGTTDEFCRYVERTGLGFEYGTVLLIMGPFCRRAAATVKCKNFQTAVNQFFDTLFYDENYIKVANYVKQDIKANMTNQKSEYASETKNQRIRYGITATACGWYVYCDIDL